jgi:hypothetical protein
MHAGEPLGELGRDLLEDRRRQQQVARVRALLVDDLLRQELEKVTVRRGAEGLDERLALVIGSVPKRDRYQVQARCPSLGLLLELQELSRLEWRL